MKSIAFFDFDGTVSRSDTFPAYIIFTKGYLSFILASLLFVPRLIYSKIFNSDQGKIKERWLAYHFKGVKKKTLSEWADQFVKHLHESGGFRSDMVKTIKSLQKENIECVIVSASPDLWIASISRSLQMAYICTELEFKEDKFTGKFSKPNCKGPEKENRIKEKYNLSEYSRIIVYGDSSGDEEMMALATEKHWIK